MVYNIQYLRAVAALAVVIHHCTYRLEGEIQVFAAGVDLFFLISGFLMLVPAKREGATPGTTPGTTAGTTAGMTPGRFMLRRLIRIVPLYWATTLVLAAVVSLAPVEFSSRQPDAWRLALSLAFLPHADQTGGLFPYLAMGWTLNYEIFFYAIVALSLRLPARLRFRAVAAVLVGLVGIGLLVAPRMPALATWTNPLLLEFLAGGGLAMLRARGRLPGRGAGWPLIGTGLAALALVEAAGGITEGRRLLLWGLPALLVLAGALSLEPAREAPPLAWLGRLGEASYSLYLLHTLVISVVVRLVGTAAPGRFLLACLVGSIAAALACHAAFDRPVTQWLRGLPTRPHRPSLAATPLGPQPVSSVR